MLTLLSKVGVGGFAGGQAGNLTREKTLLIVVNVFNDQGQRKLKHVVLSFSGFYENVK